MQEIKIYAPAVLILLTKRDVLSQATLICSKPTAKQQRRKPSPEAPNALPGTQATSSCWTSFEANSFELKPVVRTLGNA